MMTLTPIPPPDSSTWRIVSCDSCGEPTADWYAVTHPEGDTLETPICKHCLKDYDGH